MVSGLDPIMENHMDKKIVNGMAMVIMLWFIGIRHPKFWGFKICRFRGFRKTLTPEPLHP